MSASAPTLTQMPPCRAAGLAAMDRAGNVGKAAVGAVVEFVDAFLAPYKATGWAGMVDLAVRGPVVFRRTTGER